MNNYDEYDYRKTQQLEDLKKCLRIVNNYKVWQDFWNNMSIEIAELYQQNGIACVCDGDEKKIYYLREEL